LPLLEKWWVRRKKKSMTERTKEAKVARVDDGLCIFIAGQVIQGRETTADISDAEYPAVDGVY
jgi:hypothetical protein